MKKRKKILKKELDSLNVPRVPTGARILPVKATEAICSTTESSADPPAQVEPSNEIVPDIEPPVVADHWVAVAHLDSADVSNVTGIIVNDNATVVSPDGAQNTDTSEHTDEDFLG